MKLTIAVNLRDGKLYKENIDSLRNLRNAEGVEFAFITDKKRYELPAGMLDGLNAKVCKSVEEIEGVVFEVEGNECLHDLAANYMQDFYKHCKFNFVNVEFPKALRKKIIKDNNLNEWLISCIIPLNNDTAYLKEAVESVINQTIGFSDNIQLLFIEYGGTTNIIDIYKQYSREYPNNIIYIKSEAQDLNAARNIGLNRANGSFISFLDAEDKLDICFYEKLVDFCNDNKVDVSMTVINPIEKMNPSRLNPYLKYTFSKNTTFNVNANTHNMFSLINNVIFKKSLVENCFVNQTEAISDRLFLHHIILKANRYGVINTTCYNKRFVEYNISKLIWHTLAVEELLSYPMQIIKESLSKYEKVNRYSMYAAFEILVMYQENRMKDVKSSDEDINLLYKILQYIDNDVINEAFGYKKLLMPWFQKFLINIKETKSEHQYNGLYLEINDININKSKMTITGMIDLPKRYENERIVVKTNNNIIIESDMYPIETIEYLGFVVSTSLSFYIEFNIEENMDISFYIFNKMTKNNFYPMIYKNSLLTANPNSLEWFKVSQEFLIQSSPSNTIQIRSFDINILKEKLVTTINKLVENKMKLTSLNLIKQYISMLNIYKKDIILIVNPYGNNDDRIEYICSILRKNLQSFSFKYITNTPKFNDDVLFGSNEHKILSLFAEKVFTIDNIIDNRYPYEIESDLFILPLVRSLIKSEQYHISLLFSEIPNNYLIGLEQMIVKNDFQTIANNDINDFKVFQSNGSKYYRKMNLRLGLIADPVFWNSFKDVTDTVYISKKTWKDDIQGISMLMFVAAWQGLYDDWKGISCENTDARNALYAIFEYCKINKIATVFLSSEDPPHYERYIQIAKKCDYIFTAAEEMIPRYINDCGHKNVGCINFACNPIYHNPIGMCENRLDRSILFAGSWAYQHPERCKVMPMILNGAISAGYNLTIIDRNSDIKGPFSFPNEYNKYIQPKMEHQELMNLQKKYDWGINFNSVIESSTMFANRTYEFEAAGTLLISNYSLGVNHKLPLIFTCIQQYEISRILNAFTKEEIYERQITAIRHALTGNTYFDRFNKVIELMKKTMFEVTCSVLVVADILSLNIKEMFDHQTYINKDIITFNELESKYHQYDIITFFSNDMTYLPFYLEDLVNAFKYTACDYITKDSYISGDNLISGIEHNYVSKISSICRTIFWRESFTLNQLLSLKDNSKLANGYSIDHFNYNLINKDEMNENTICKYKLSVIIPVYNNGIFLYGKCFSSLRRSSLFSEMEIIIVDDGSTDKNTYAYIDMIVKRYNNVRTYFFEEGGSGSASRPRNKGVELASADYITFLDPDNEAVNDGYKILYDYAIKDDLDLCLGNIIKLTTKKICIDYYSNFISKLKTDYISIKNKNLLIELGFMPMSIQAMVIKRSLITKNNLEQVVGGIGQDSLFSIQLLHYAELIRVINLPIHIYYAGNTGSAVNDIGYKFFNRSLLTEKEQLKWLLKENLINNFMQNRFNFFYSKWYLNKKGSIKPKEENESKRALLKILNIYLPYYNFENNEINEFLEDMKNIE